MKVRIESEVAQSCPTLSDPMTAAYQVPPPMGFSRQEYWSGVPLPSPRLAHRSSQTSSLKNVLLKDAIRGNAWARENGEESTKVLGEP